MDLEPKKKAIVEHGNGPLLVVAGPGAGKTMVMVERVVNLIVRRHIAPGAIFVSTFTEKAAKELLTRISRRLMEEDIDVPLNEMFIGTMHSLFLRILKDYAPFTRMRKNYRIFDDFDRKYFVYRNIHCFYGIEGIEKILTSRSRWMNAETLGSWVDKVREEAIAPEKLVADKDVDMRLLGKMLERYTELLSNENAIDFSGIQSEMLLLIEGNKEILKELQKQINYIIVDEYQDTNAIQERILLKLAGESANICVVGDEDQSIYRFRGASVRNILQFEQNFPEGKCKKAVLDTNYRSHPDIVRFYNEWMKDESWEEGDKKFRYRKTISPQGGKTFDNCPGVIRISGDDREAWCEEIYHFIKKMLSGKVVANLNQIAFLFHSVKNKNVIHLAEYLEERNIGVFSPRSARFFGRETIKQMIGLFFFLFPQARIFPDEMQEYQRETAEYYRDCMMALAAAVKRDPAQNEELLKWARRCARRHEALMRTTDYSFLSLFYEALKFPLFAGIIGVSHDGTPQTSRDAFNLALFSQLIAKFEFIYSIDVLSPKRLDGHLRQLFMRYLHFLIRGGIEEFEDYEQTVPDDCVSFMTIHQSKGLEFPVAVVGSLDRTPRKDWTLLDKALAESNFCREPFEPFERIKFFDFYREYYVAFSRAQNLLILTGFRLSRGNYSLGKMFDRHVAKLPDWKSRAFSYKNLHLAKVKSADVKNIYSFTTDIILYENCPLQYMAYRYLGFAPHRRSATMFGSLVHQTIEDVHKAYMRGEEFDRERIEGWFNENYESLSRAMKAYLGEAQRAVALEHVTRYVSRNGNAFSRILDAEHDVSVPAKGFILKGVIDLLRGDGDTIEIVDFKTDSKPDVNDPDDASRLENYHRQLETYAHIIEKKYRKSVTKMHLYYTRAEGETPYVTWDYDRNQIERTMKEIAGTVERIERHSFSSENVKKCARLCDGCDMRYYCQCK